MNGRPTAIASLAALWFGFERRVGRRAYVVSGVALMIAKYLIDAVVAWAVTGLWWDPWRYLCPMWSVRMAQFSHAPSALFVAFGVMALPSAQRTVGTGGRHGHRSDDGRAGGYRRCHLRLHAVLHHTPDDGVIAGYVVNRPVPRPVYTTIAAAVLSTILASCVLLLLALEGVICIAMAAPIALFIVMIGGFIGRHIAMYGRPAAASLLIVIAAMPLLGFTETVTNIAVLHEVVTTIDVEAPPDVVWTHVVSFSELPAPSDVLFHTGIAYPMRARITGAGVGAVRRCEFSTGAFVEPITAWEPGRRLAFDVRSQPPAMQEWSFYASVHPPHLDTLLRSRRGEFRLIARSDGTTRLEGHTWYSLSASPTMYWRVWSDAIIHRIHTRVLAHVKRLSEERATGQR